MLVRRSPDVEPAENLDAPLEPGFGLLELHPNGYGFLRSPENNYSRERTDPFVPGTMIEKYGLRPGLMIHGMVQQARKQTGPRLREITEVDGIKPEEYVNVKSFDELTPINPEEWLQLETGPQPLTTRVMDLLTPLGKGQRALIVAPPRTGKTIMLQHISQGVSTNHPELKLIVLLIDERPEEVTDMRRNVNGEVVASSLDQDVESHVRLSPVDRRTLPAIGRNGPGRVPADGLDHASGASVQQVGGQHRPHDERWCGHQGDGHPQEALRDRPRLRGRWVADRRRHRPDRYRQPHGRADLPGVQGDRQHGVGVGSQAGRPPCLARDRHLRSRVRGAKNCC